MADQSFQFDGMRTHPSSGNEDDAEGRIIVYCLLTVGAVLVTILAAVSFYLGVLYGMAGSL